MTTSFETQIYDNPEDDPKLKRSGKQPVAPAAGLASTMQGAGVGATALNAAAANAWVAAIRGSPDLSSLVSTAKGWDAAGVGPQPGQNGAMPPPPATLAHGSNKVPSPLNDSGVGFPTLPQPLSQSARQNSQPMPSASGGFSGGFGAAASSGSFGAVARESSVPQRLVSASDPAFDPLSSYSGSVRREDKQRGIALYAGLGGAIAVALIVIVSMKTCGGKKDDGTIPQVATGPTTTPTTTPTTATTPTTTPPPPVVGDQNTGFDLYVNPGGVTQWKLDGESRSDRLPSRIRGIAPGAHTVVIDAPPGFMSQSQQVAVDAGKSSKVEITAAAHPRHPRRVRERAAGRDGHADRRRQASGPRPEPGQDAARSAHDVSGAVRAPGLRVSQQAGDVHGLDGREDHRQPREGGRDDQHRAGDGAADRADADGRGRASADRHDAGDDARHRAASADAGDASGGR